MKKEKELTGYPHIDKPWMKYYDQNEVGKTLPKETIYRYMKNRTKNYLDNNFITYNGKTENGYSFMDNIDKASSLLYSIGIEKGMRVMYLMPNIPETAYLFYGGSKIGAISDYVDPRPDSINPKISSQKLLKMIVNEKVKSIVVFESCFLPMIKPIENELKEMGIGPIVIVSSEKLMTNKQRLFYVDESVKLYGLKSTLKKLKYMKQHSKQTYDAINNSPLEIIDYSNLLEDCRYIKTNENPFEPNSIAVFTHSSGTTSSFPKTIPLKNEGINSYAFQLIRSNINTDIGDSALHILPYFAAYGIGITHMGFSNADNMIEMPEFGPNSLGRIINKYKANVIMGTPNWCYGLTRDKTLKNIDLSYVKLIGFGGDSMNPYDEIETNEFLEEHGCKVPLTKGHGMSETSGGASYATGDYNVPGSMGIPMIDTIYGIVDPETKVPIKFNDEENTISGELIISSPAIVDESIDGRKVIEHGMYDGKDYIYTKDLGTMDKNGVLYFLSRDDRGFARYDGFKVKPYEIEKQIKKVDFIKDCIIGPYDDIQTLGRMIRADIIVKDEYLESNIISQKEMVQQIIDEAFVNNPDVSTRQIPTKFIFRSEYPMTVNNKVDYKFLAKEPLDGTEITVVLDETNVSISGIRIIDPNNKKVLKR